MTPILPPATLGMLGGGQLGRFFVQAAHELGYRVWVLDPDKDSPAGRIADRQLAAAFDDPAALAELAGHCAAVSTEFENVPAATLEHLAGLLPVHPSAAAVAICQDRISEKGFLKQHGLPVGECLAVRAEGDLAAAGAVLFPGVLKVARLGYDGKGQARVNTSAEALTAFREFGGVPCMLEAVLPLDCEISVVLVRDGAGRTSAFPPAENRHRNGILDVSIIPARVSAALATAARECAERIAGHLGYVGTLAVEFFVSRGRLLVNEIAPRPHNSGHYTLDVCITSQFEQQVRALCGLPLGATRATSAAVMVNLLGDLWFTGESSAEPDWSRLLAVPELKLHLYGKTAARRGRKMGHFTVLGADLAATVKTALKARQAIGIPDE